MFRWKIKIHQTKERTFLWGGMGVARPYVGDTAELFFRNDDLGETCVFGVRNLDRDRGTALRELGILAPGECWLIGLRDIHGVWVKCEDPKVDTVIECLIHPRT